MRQKISLDENWLFHRGDIIRKRPTSKGPIYTGAKTVRERWGAASYDLSLIHISQVKAGLDDYDVTLQELMHCYTLAIEGNALELKSEVPGLDMSGVWWDQNSINDLSINNKLYFVTSDFDTTRFDNIPVSYTHLTSHTRPHRSTACGLW